METSIEQVILISNWDIMYNQNQFWPKIDKFPWFRPDQVEWLEKKTAHLPEGERQQTQQGLYRELLPRVIAKQRNEQRMAVKNEYYQKNLQKPDKERQLWNMYLRQEDLADIVKSNFGLKHDLSTEDTMKGIRKYMANDNIDEQYLLDYLNGKNDELLYQLEIKERKPEGKYQSGALKGMLSRAGENWGIWEWVNPIGRATEYLDDLIQKIPAVSFEGREEELRKRIDAIGEEERKAFEETFKNNRTLQALYGNVDNYIKESKKTFMDQFLGIGDEGPNVVKQILNIPWSFLKTASWISRAMTNPLDTVVGLKNLLTTEEWRQLVIDRYWTNFQQTLEEDPIGLASDVLSVVGMWWGALAKGAKLAGLESTASKIGKFASVADNVGNLGLDVVKAKGMGMLGEIGGGWNALTKAGVKYVQLTQAPLQTAGEMTKGIIKALPSAEHTLQNMNRLTKWEQSKFKSMVWESQGEWMNNRGIVAGGESAVDQLAEYFVNSKKKVDEALQTIGGEYKNPYLDMMAKEASEFAENTLSKEAWRIKELAQKAETQGLTMSEINEVKRFYEKNNKFTYGKDITAGEKSVRATNIDNNVREWQMDIAEENGFWNLRELNKETQASKFLLDKLVKNNDGSFGNNFFTLTDYITAVWLWDITALPWIFTKKMMSSDWFRTNYAKIINKINGHQTIAEKIADIEVIKKIQNKKALEKFLKDGYNTKNQNLNSNSNQDAIDLHVHSRGASLDDWQSIQKQTAQIEGSLWEINEGASWRVWLKWNIERSDGKKTLTEESIIEKYRQKAIQELGLPEWTTEINLAELMGDKKKYAKYQEITAEMQKELWYLWEDGYYTKKWHDDLESRKRKAYGEQKHSLRDDEGLDKLREWAETKYQLAEPIKSENFKKWFGDWENDPKNASKVVNEKGEPLLMYHGSPEKFTIFDSEFMSLHGSSKGYGFYFSPDKNMAQWYGDLMQVYLDIKNPLSKDKLSISRKEMKNLILDVEKNIAEKWGSEDGTLLDNFGDTRRYGRDRVLEDAIDILMENESDVDVFGELKNIGGDYDSVAKSFRKILGKDGIITPKEYIVFESNQIKSATDNIWTFDANNPDIRYQKHGVANPLEKEISAQRAIQLENIRNGRSVQELADHYGIDIQIVDKITTPEGLKAYGKYGDGVITLAEKIKEGTAPHELFHATFDVVDHARKESILRQIEKSKGLDSLNAEEYLADSFSEYFRTGKFDTKSFGKGLVEKIKQYFYQVKQFITGANKNKAQIKKLFDEILDGEIKHKESIVWNKVSFQILKQEFPDLKEVGEWEFGTIYEGVKWTDAEQLLIKQQGGEVRGAYTFEKKPVDLIRWSYNKRTESGIGLSKISQKHPEVLWKIQDLLDSLPILKRDTKEIVLWDKNSVVVIKLQYLDQKKRWIMTAYDRNWTKKL